MTTVPRSAPHGNISGTIRSSCLAGDLLFDIAHFSGPNLGNARIRANILSDVFVIGLFFWDGFGLEKIFAISTLISLINLE